MGYPEDPEIVYGFGPSMKYKNWDFSFFFQGAARTSILMSGFIRLGKATRGVMKLSLMIIGVKVIRTRMQLIHA